MRKSRTITVRMPEETVASSAVATLQFTALGESDAERLLAAIWRVLEEHGLPTPRLDIRSGNRSLDITVTFQSAGDCAAIRKGVDFVLHST
jgi:hypothetical protein